jgi:hypothetical protein
MQAGLALFFEDFNEFRRAVDLGHLYSGKIKILADIRLVFSTNLR